MDELVAAGLNVGAILMSQNGPGLSGQRQPCLSFTTGPGRIPIWSLSSELSGCILRWGRFLEYSRRT